MDDIERLSKEIMLKAKDQLAVFIDSQQQLIGRSYGQ